MVRFPGQYADTETELQYNYYRYYDAATGRYISSDRVGLSDGVNTYSYVRQSPVSFYDPNGLSRFGYLNGLAPNPAYVDPTFSETEKNLVRGAGTFFRGHYRNLRHAVRSSGLRGKCEKFKAGIEGQALLEAIDRISNHPLLASDVNFQAWDTVLSNKAKSIGRFGPNFAVSTYATRRSGAMVGGLTVGSLSSGISVTGDIRYLTETQGPRLLLDYIGKTIGDGSVPANIEDWFDCGCVADY